MYSFGYKLSGSNSAVNRAMQILYVGTRHRDEVEPVVPRGTVIHDAPTIYDGIALLKRLAVNAALVEFERLAPDPARAVAVLREAAGERPVLVTMTSDEWDAMRGRGVLEPNEVLLRPYYPDELWGRIQRAVLPPQAAAVAGLRNDADHLFALISDAQRLNRFTNDLAAFAQHCVAIIQARVRAGRVSLFLKSEREGELAVVQAAGLEKEVKDQAILRLGEGVAGELALKQRTVLVREAGKDGPASDRTYASASYMIAPMLYEQEVVGVLCATERFEPGPFTDRDARYIEAFSAMAAQIAHNGLQYRAADELATIDEGTQLYNRRHFNRVGPQEVNRARRYEHDLTLALMDLDHFKQYNDANGHQAGDRALAVVSRCLKASFREADIVVRYGGEEFAVIMPETSRKEGDGVEFVDRARRKVEEAALTFEDEGGNLRVLTISGGVATFPLQADNWEELFEKADQALYKAKARGRNIIVGY